MIFCTKLKKEGEAIDFQPFPDALGKKIIENISKEAWGMWIKHQTMLINEKSLCLSDKKARIYLKNEMEKYLFGGNYEKVKGYIPQ
jgi:Fe-S cluster biosynthesis and repair protein YggX